MGIKTVATLEQEFQDALNEIKKVKENLKDYLFLLDKINCEIANAGFCVTSISIDRILRDIEEEVNKL